MAQPVLIDTDMGVDDAVAIALALGSDELDLVGLASVGGNVPVEQATLNILRYLSALGITPLPPVAAGFDQHDPALKNAAHVFGEDGLGGVALPSPPPTPSLELLDLYESSIDRYGSQLAIVAIGPLTNLAFVLRERPSLLQHAGKVIIMGGAVFRPGNVTPAAEFNFYRDPDAARQVLSAGLPMTVVPLDVTTQVALDESHVAHLARSGTRSGELLAEMIQFPLSRDNDSTPGTFVIHDAVAVGLLLWPEMFVRSRMALDIITEGPEAGRSKPMVAKDPKRKLHLVMSLPVVDFLENLLETLCHEKFVV